MRNEFQTLEEKREKGLELMLNYEKMGGLVQAIAQDYQTGEVLIAAFANEAAFLKTLQTGYATFWSRSEESLWAKGESSGNRLIVRDILVDCDQDALIYLVEKEKGGACHTKDQNGNARNSCFYRRYDAETGMLEFIGGMR